MQNSILKWLWLAALAVMLLPIWVVMRPPPPPANAQAKVAVRATAHGISLATWRPDTAVVITRAQQTVLVTITCPFGIDQGVLRRSAETWPEKVRIRLRLSGLESFKAANGTTEIRWSVSNSKDRRTSVSLRTGPGISSGARTRILAPDSPYWTTVLVGAGTQQNPSSASYMEVSLPPKLFANNPREIRLHWVDFYRR